MASKQLKIYQICVYSNKNYGNYGILDYTMVAMNCKCVCERVLASEQREDGS